MTIALVGDYDPNVTAHRAIPAAIELASLALGQSASIQWLDSPDIGNQDLQQYSGFWCIPASPYRQMKSVLDVICFARQNDVPFLGTCGGYQHAALEYARNALGYSQADNTEVNPATTMPLISALACRLSAEAGMIQLQPDSKLSAIYGAGTITETYNCGFGVNRDYLAIFTGTEMQFIGFDDTGDPRALELVDHRFFIGTAFQPERSAFTGQAHSLVKSFLAATM